ncbi:multiple sugar transport system substrate-binding protein [Deinococcus metalli]|uniref:Multiple sugar transport system substrate-binding protein n=1 Tax=Deinococcus metalli TaxID=1141878 RepID=A0A7W8KCR0_9DEIO|nr:sugar ABC transporter substrate-binding protein [Deinococcus metalli]MBB5375701.1 multiple sugar transport system substrate-binding protein [Deinococcus metalli]GHF37676.1 sugar ABC transporter substrate-binding protein [Deinococcus metalli]
MKKIATLTAALTVLAGPIASAAQAATTLQYWLWDSNQQPAYQSCATAFTKANPDITIKITQKGWNDYWTGITTGFVSGTAPDVFTDHLAYFPQFAANNQLVDLAPLIAKDKVATNIYYPGLKDLWGRDGKQYGLPKDWDTVGIFYNKDLLAKAGLKESDLANLTWNSKDGGTFQSTIAKLTKDKSGNNGLSAKFDKKNVAQYGYETGFGAGFNGQTEWAFLAATTGWKYNDGLYATKYYYNDKRFTDTIQWLADLNLKHGLIPSFQEVQSGSDSLFRAGKVAMVTNGSWMIGDYTGKLPFKVGVAPLPKGPNGKRMSMFNGLADSIWVGSKNQDAAWQWVKFLASPTCQNIVGNTGVVFPAIPAAAAASQAKSKSRGVDVAPFINQAKLPGGTFYFPITDHISEVNDIMSSAMQQVYLGKATAAAALPAANDKVNALFK